MAGHPAGSTFVDLDDLLPDDMAFQIGGESFPVPGDVPVPVILSLQKALGRLQDLDGTPVDDGTTERVTGAIANLHAEVVALLGLRREDCARQAAEERAALAAGREPDPELAVVQLGMRGAVAIVESVMVRMGATPIAEAEPEGGARPTRRGTTGRSKRPAAKTRSR